MDPTPDTPSSLAAPPSRWALATRGDPVALGELAGSYWYCAYVWWRRSGLDAEAAGPATVASFTRWLTISPPMAEQSGAGLMREWLPARLREMAAEGWEMDGEPAIGIESEWAEKHYPDEPEGEPDALFHRRWTLTVLEFTMQALRAEYAARGLEMLYGEVAPFIGFEGADEAHYAAAADRTGMTVGALRRAVFDFRTHHREVLRSILADTVADPGDIDSEITALLCACDLPAGPETRPAPLPTAIRTFKPEELLARAMNTVQMTSGGGGYKWTPPSDDEVSRLFPQFEMLGMIGRGGMGAVYRARQVALDREVAIKLLPLEVSADQAFANRFVREARAMAKLTHPNIISVFDFGTTAEGHLFFVMEYVEGANVSEIIRGPGLEPDQAMVITGQVCTALAYAHGKGVIHRDIKPANVMVGTDGSAKVADFGLARMAGADPEQYGQTVTGTIMGTPEYMAPEQKRGMAVDHRADIYSVGVMLYEMLCKEPPQGAFEPPSERVHCDARIDQVVIKAMNRTPEGRYQSTTEMKMAIEAVRTPFPTQPGNHAARRNVGGGGTGRAVTLEKKSPAGLVFGLLAAALASVGAVVYFQAQNKKPAEKRPLARVSPTPHPVPSPTPAPEFFGPAIPTDFKPPEEKPTVAMLATKEVPAELPTPATMVPPLTTDPPSPPTKVKSSVAPDIAAAPVASALVAASNDPRLMQVETAFNARFDKDAQRPYLALVAALNQSYLVNGVARVRIAAQARGSLDEVTALDAEKAAIGRGEGVPATDHLTIPESLKALRTEYRTLLGKYAAERAKTGGQIYDLYLAALDGYMVELTRANKIDEAKKVKAVREEIAVKKTELTQPGYTEAPRSGQLSAVPAPGAGAPLREVAKWLLSAGVDCRMTVTKGNLQSDVLAERDLPPGKFEIISLSIERRGSQQPALTAADLQTLKAIKTLRTVWVLSPNLGDAAFEFLNGNAELTSVALHSENFTDGVLAHLADARKLTDFKLVYSKNFSGRDLHKMRWLPGLTQADFSSSGFSDEGLKALLFAPRLRALKLYGPATAATDAGLASLAAHPTLSELSFEGCKSFSDAGLAVLGKMRTLNSLNAAGTGFGDTAAASLASHGAIRQLNLKGTPLTDAGLSRLATLTKLETLNVNSTRVTPAGLEAFSRVAPKCLVTP